MVTALTVYCIISAFYNLLAYVCTDANPTVLWGLFHFVMGPIVVPLWIFR